MPNPTVEIVDQEAERAIDSVCDAIAGLGGS